MKGKSESRIKAIR